MKNTPIKKNILPAIVMVASFTLIGGFLLIWIFAASPSASIEAESGTLTAGATIGNNSSASGGKYTQFGTNQPGVETIAAAGDIACDPADPMFNNLNGTATACQMKATSNLVLGINPKNVLALGDIQYDLDTMDRYLASYDKTWGRFKTITRPIIGNHEGGEGATHSNKAYFDYFNGAGVQTGLAGDRTKGYYSYNVGAWHIVALNSNCGTYWFGGVQTGCQAGSPQETWLRQDLAANSAQCTLAYWHVPRFSSGGSHHNSAATDTVYNVFWNDLYNAKAEIVLNGHDHDYERFAPQKPDGTADSVNGVREFVVGNGGRNLYSFTATVTNSQIRNSTDFGVLKLVLHSSSYDWQFINIANTVVDSGTTNCH